MGYYFEFSKKTLKAIDDHIDELDGEGLYVFCNNVLLDSVKGFEGLEIITFTLAVFLMKLFNDDVKELADELISCGFHKWSNIDEFNRVCGEGYDWNGQFVEFELGFLYSYYFDNYFGGLPSSENPGEYIPVDVEYIRKNSDFSTTEWVPTMPFITKIVLFKNIPKDMYDELYVGIPCDPDSWAARGMHAVVAYITGSQEMVPGEDGVEYESIKDLIEDLAEYGDELDPNYALCAALPKEIIEKYGWHIKDGTY